MTIRRVTPTEIDLHRDVRLRALRDAPDSFGETYERVAALDVDAWARRTHHVTNEETGVMFVTAIDDVVVGCTYGLVDPDRTAAGRVGGMWVDPAYRGQGVARALLRAVLDWTVERGFDSVRLWAPEHVNAALRLYGGAGFVMTGQRKPLPTNETQTIVEMELLHANAHRRQ